MKAFLLSLLGLSFAVGCTTEPQESKSEACEGARAKHAALALQRLSKGSESTALVESEIAKHEAVLEARLGAEFMAHCESNLSRSYLRCINGAQTSKEARLCEEDGR